MKVWIWLLFCVLSAGMSGSCHRQPQIDTGEEVDLAAETIDTGGGTITIAQPGDPLDGLTIQVPEAAYPESTPFAVSYRPVTGHTFGSNFTPISPLISIDNGERFADDIITMTIPVEIPDGYFAMAFYYDEESGELEGIPLLDEDASSITIGTRHFSDIIVSMIAEELLYKPLDTGFTHGKDDWQFTNNGSCVAPAGHCAGQSMAAMYYFIDKKRKEGAPDLYGRYDNDGNDSFKTPEFESDDELAYKLCSMTQKKIDFDSSARKYWLARQDSDRKTAKSDIYTFYCFSYAFLLTGSPQYVSVQKVVDAGTDNETFDGGHALIAYKTSGKTTRDGRDVTIMYVSDPNCPAYTSNCAAAEEIVFDIDAGTFQPYAMRSHAGNDASTFNRIYYVAKGALVDRAVLEELWGEFEAGTIGQEESGFPEYSLTAAYGDTEVSMYDGMEITATALSVELCLEGEFSIFDTTRKKLTIYRVDADNFGRPGTVQEVRSDEQDVDAIGPCLQSRITGLTEDTCMLGFLVEAEHCIDYETNRNGWVYAGFDWYRVTVKEPEKHPCDASEFLEVTVSDPEEFDPAGSGTLCRADVTLKNTGDDYIWIGYKDNDLSWECAGGWAYKMETKPGGEEVLTSAFLSTRVYTGECIESHTSQFIAMKDTWECEDLFLESIESEVLPEGIGIIEADPVCECP